jgi:hypothetical protein
MATFKTPSFFYLFKENILYFSLCKNNNAGARNKFFKIIKATRRNDSMTYDGDLW